MYLTKWSEAVHNTPDQKKRQDSARRGDMQILQIDAAAKSCLIKSQSGDSIYRVTTEDCTCADFQRHKLPCKHMYKLDLALQTETSEAQAQSPAIASPPDISHPSPAQQPVEAQHLASATQIEKKGKREAVTLILALLFGWLGIHRFYNGKIITGIIWLFTFGLFFVGWAVDVLIILYRMLPPSVAKRIRSFLSPQGEGKNKAVSLLLAIPLGWLGIHRFYNGKVITGIAWLFTFGLFFIGWIIDVIVILLSIILSHSKKIPKDESTSQVKSEPLAKTDPVPMPTVQQNVSTPAPVLTEPQSVSLSSPSPVEQQTVSSPEPTVSAPAEPEPPIKQKITVTADDLIYNEVLMRYLYTDHSKVKPIYDYYSYYRAEFNCMLNNIPLVNIILHDETATRNTDTPSPFVRTSTITPKSSVKTLSNFVVIDVETTGRSARKDDIIEISAIKFERFKPTVAFTTLLKPKKPIPVAATSINGITDSMVENSPEFSQIKSALEEFIGSYPIVAHKAEFDIGFLHASGLEFSPKVRFFDTLTLSHRHVKDSAGDKLDNYKLATVCAECSIYFDGAHRSTADAFATGLLFIEIVKRVFQTDNLLDIQK